MQLNHFARCFSQKGVKRSLAYLLEVGVEDLPDRGFRQRFPANPQNAFGSANSVWLPPLPADPTQHQVVIS